MSKEPLVSILMNCYNGEKYLAEAIDSVLNQTYKNWEIVFWDNQSDDHSSQIFHSYADPRLKYFYAPKHTWLYEARNFAISKARGDFIAFLDVDDSWLPTKLEKQMPLFSDPDVGLVCSNYFLKNEKKKRKWTAIKGVIPSGRVLEALLENYFVGLLTLVVRRVSLEAMSYPCNPRYHVIGDLDLVVRLSADWKLDCIQEATAVCRKHESNELVKHRGRHLQELEWWIDEMGKTEKIKSCPSFPLIQINAIYQNAIYQILLDNKMEALRLFRDLPWGRLKLRLAAALILPTVLFRHLRSD